MKRFSTVLLICFGFLAQAQNPHGTLFLNVNGWGDAPKPTLGYITYLSQPVYNSTFKVFDSVLVHDIHVADELYVGNDSLLWWYDLDSLQRKDSLPGVGARRIQSWNNHLLVSCVTPPYFRVFDVDNNYSLVYQIDTPQIDFPIQDFTVLGDKAWLLLPNDVVPVDLHSQNLLTPINFQAPSFFRAGRSMCGMGDKLYMLLEYYTALPRSDLFRLDTATLQVDSLAHQEITLSYDRPICTGNAIFYGSFPNRYSLATDSLMDFIQDSAKALAYDPTSQTIFSGSRFHVGAKVTLFHNEQAVAQANPPLLPSEVNASFFHSQILTLSADSKHLEEPAHQIFPNPNTGQMTLLLSDKQAVYQISIWSYDGQLIHSEKALSGSSSINLPDISNGLYFIRVEGNKSIEMLPFTVLH